MEKMKEYKKRLYEQREAAIKRRDKATDRAAKTFYEGEQMGLKTAIDLLYGEDTFNRKMDDLIEKVEGM